MSKKKDNFEELVEEVNDNKSLNKKEKKKNNKFRNVLFVIALLLGIAYILMQIKDSFNNINYMKDILNYSSLLIILIFITISIIGSKSLRHMFSIVSAILIILLVGFNMLENRDIVKLPTLTVMKNLNNVSLVDAMKWASNNKVELNTTYEFSDNYKEGYIISQSVIPNTVLKKIKKISIVVSDGPNYEKEVVLNDMSGLKVDDLLKFINENHLNNVEIIYEVNNEIDKDTIISQSTKGEIKRKDKVSFTVSLGNVESLEPIKIKDLKNMSEFDATIYLKRNGIKYNITYEFNSKIKRGYVISQDKKANSKVDPKQDTVNLVISKGKEIIVPDFTNKNTNDVLDWITKNNLKVGFNETYSTSVKSGDLIGINYEKNEKIEEGTKIIITTSKGSLTVPNINSLAEFINWANANGIKYTQEYQYNNNVPKGGIISSSLTTGSKVDPSKDNISIVISYGAPVTIPNFVGKGKGEITTTCKNAGLNCAFYYIGYSSTAADVATNQTIPAGNKVVNGTYIKIGLSNGPAKTYNVYIQAEWMINSTADNTIATLKNYFNSNCPGVTFNYVKKPNNSSPSGFIHPSSPIQGGNNNFTQGQTYTIWIVE